MATTAREHRTHETSDDNEFVSSVLGVMQLKPECLDDDGLDLAVELCGQLRGMVSTCEARFAEEIRRRRGAYAAEETLRKRQRMSAKKAKRRAKTAHATANNPSLNDALESGDISEEHADTLADAEEKHEGATDALIGKAKEQGPDRFRNTARDWSREQDGNDSEAQRQYNRRSAKKWTRPDDGMSVFLAELDPESNAMLTHALATALRRRRAANSDLDDETLVALTSDKVLFDTFMDIIRAYLRGDPTSGSTAVTMLLIDQKGRVVNRGIHMAELEKAISKLVR